MSESHADLGDQSLLRGERKKQVAEGTGYRQRHAEQVRHS